MSSNEFHPPIWDRGEGIDAEMMRFTIGDDWRMDQRLVGHDLVGSMAHVDGLLEAGLIASADHAALRAGLEELHASWRRGEWSVEPGDEDVHSAVERRLIEAIGEPGERLHTGRSRNDQVALDMRLWLREALATTRADTEDLLAVLRARRDEHQDLHLPGYTHLRRAMPSSVGDWLGAHVRALELGLEDLESVRPRLATCPLGSGAGYGVPLPLQRAYVARALGFDAPEEPVTATQVLRGRAELAFANALEGLALDLEKLAFDLWLFSSEEFGFLSLPTALTTGSSLMPHKRNPDVVELLRGQARLVRADRDGLRAVLGGLPSGYHRDFQLAKGPLFRATDALSAMLRIAAPLVAGLTFDEEALRVAAEDPALDATRRALEAARAGESFRGAYRRLARE